MNEIIKPECDISQKETKVTVIDNKRYEQPFGKERIAGFFDEIIACARDDRLNTKRAISSDAASREMVQKQNSQLISAYESELQRDDLTNEQRLDILNKMYEISRSTAQADKESRAFQSERLLCSHKRSGQLLAFGAVVVLGVGGVALFRNRPA